MSARQIVSTPRYELVDMEALLARVTRERRMREAPPINYAGVLFKRRLAIEKAFAQKRVAAINKMSRMTTTSTNKAASSPLKNGEIISYAIEEVKTPETTKSEPKPIRMLFGDCKGVDVKLLVGTNNQEFHVEKWNLVYHSTVFQHLIRDQNDPRFEPLVVKNVEPDAFQLFNTWMSTGELPQLQDEHLLALCRQENEPIEIIWDDLMSRAYMFAMEFGCHQFARDIYRAYAWILARSRDEENNFDALLIKDTLFWLIREAPNYPLSELFAMEFVENWSRTEEGREALLFDCLPLSFLQKVTECYRSVQQKKQANGGVLPGTVVLPPPRRRWREAAANTRNVAAPMEIREPDHLSPNQWFLQRFLSLISL
ncbi:hypothetical protein HDK77DRAFT_495769 [Phyllosticta capitalensis]